MTTDGVKSEFAFSSDRGTGIINTGSRLVGAEFERMFSTSFCQELGRQVVSNFVRLVARSGVRVCGKQWFLQAVLGF